MVVFWVSSVTFPSSIIMLILLPTVINLVTTGGSNSNVPRSFGIGQQ